MKTALETANEMERMGIIGRYAIAGSVAIIYYAAPVDTEDLDIFFLHGLRETEIFSVDRIYDYLRTRGFSMEQFSVIIDGVRVQFVPSTGPLSNEALEKAQDVTMFEVPTRVILPEYLISLKLKAGRSKDFIHIVHLLETSRRKIDFGVLEDILDRFGSRDRWVEFERKTAWRQQ